MKINDVFGCREPNKEQIQLIQNIDEASKKLAEAYINLRDSRSALEQIITNLDESLHKDTALTLLWRLKMDEWSDDEIIIEVHKVNMMANSAVVLSKPK